MVSERMCKVCKHQERGRIELETVSGVSHTVIAQRYGLSRYSVLRHSSRHISPERRSQLIAGPVKLKELAERAVELDLSLIDYLQLMRSTLVAQFLAASEASDRNGTGLIAGRLLDVLRMQASLTGELRSAGATVTNNTLILSSPLMADIEQVLLERLRPYPDAAQAVFEGLEQLRAARLGSAHQQHAVVVGGRQSPLPALVADAAEVLV